MGQRYSITRDQFVPTGGQDMITIVSASGRRVRLVALEIGGQGSSSAPQELRICRSTGGTTGGGAITPNKAEHSDQPAAVSTVNTTWSAQPAQDGNGPTVTWNALGGPNRWGTQPGRPNGMIEARNGENISIFAPSGPTYQKCSVSATIEED